MPQNGRKRILVADNDVEVLIALEHALETKGYDTSVALDAKEIFWAVSQVNIDALVLDDYLSDKDSIEVLAEFRREGMTPLVIITYHRYPSPRRQQQLFSLGASALINKGAHSELARMVDCLFELQTISASR